MGKEIAKSIPQQKIPDGFYVGSISAYTLTILSQDYFGINIELERGLRGKNIIVVVFSKDNIAYCYDRMIKPNISFYQNT